jgi:hypothetical protein
MNPKVKNTLYTGLFYLAVWLLLAVQEPGGPCAPNVAGMFIVLAAMLTALILIVRDLIFLGKGDKNRKYSLAVHIAAISIAFINA